MVTTVELPTKSQRLMILVLWAGIFAFPMKKYVFIRTARTMKQYNVFCFVRLDTRPSLGHTVENELVSAGNMFSHL